MPDQSERVDSSWKPGMHSDGYAYREAAEIIKPLESPKFERSTKPYRLKIPLEGGSHMEMGIVPNRDPEGKAEIHFLLPGLGITAEVPQKSLAEMEESGFVSDNGTRIHREIVRAIKKIIEEWEVFRSDLIFDNNEEPGED